jgi:hypothetical protein
MTVAGVVAAAIAVTFLLTPAIRQLGWPDYWWVVAALILFLPPAALLVATSFTYYGLWRSVAVATVVMGIATVVTVLVAVFTFAAALGGSGAAPTLGIGLMATPGVLVLILGLVAQFVVNARDGEHPATRVMDDGSARRRSPAGRGTAHHSA